MLKLQSKNIISRSLSGFILLFLLIYSAHFYNGILLFIIILASMISFLEMLLVSKYKSPFIYILLLFGLYFWNITSQTFAYLSYKSFPIGIAESYNFIEPTKLLFFLLAIVSAPLFLKKIKFKTVVIYLMTLIILVIATKSIIWLLFKSADYGNGFEVFLLVPGIVFSTDTGGFIVGTLFGKHKIMQKISPKKKWEGFVGGLLFAYIWIWFWISFLFVPFVDENTKLTLSFILSTSWIFVLSSLVGDLYFSYIKRMYKVDDFSKIIPGHGGVLDRMDSIIFALIISRIIYNFVF